MEISPTMRAVRITNFGPLDETLHLENDVPTPTPSENEVLVKIEAAAINPSDVKNVQGLMKSVTTLPRIPGRDFAGTVVSGPEDLVGKAVWGTGGGDLGFTRDGSHAEYLLLPREAVSVRPANLSAAEAASVGVGFLTAWVGLMERAKLLAGETVLVIGATGAVGSAVCQIAKRMGASRVVAAVRFSGDSGATPSLHGADAVVNFALRQPLDEQVRDALGGSGANIVFNGVGGPTFEPGIAALATGGRMVVIAATVDPHVPLNLLDFYRRDLQLLGVNTLRQTTGDAARILTTLAPGFESGALLAPLVETYPLAQAAGAYELVALGSIRAKVVLDMG